jgi:hypothetical protein
MVAVSKDKDLAEKLNVKQEVAKEFIKKDEEEGLWQAAPELNEIEVESLTLEAVTEQELISKEMRDDAKEAPMFRMEDRFVEAGDGGAE